MVSHWTRILKVEKELWKKLKVLQDHLISIS